MATLVVDNLSPFTPDIMKCLDRLGAKYTYKKYFEVADSDLQNCERVILSGRRKNDKETNAANSKIIRYCHDSDVPLLGICYGAEIIALALGGSIRRMQSHVQGQIDVSTKDSALTPGKDKISVYESHGYCVARLPQGFAPVASSDYCQHEIFAHRSKKIYGTQFHPEKSGQDGLDLLARFAKL